MKHGHLELRLDALAFGGDAVGRDADGRVVFVPGGAPGDLCELEVVESKRRYARAELVRVIEPGARVAAPCPLAATCGGCPWMHVEGSAQLAAKEEIVRHALAKSGAQVLPILPAPAWLGWRARAKMTARGQAIGFQARRSHRVVDVPACPALDPRLDAAMQLARGALRGALGEGGTLAGLISKDGRVHLAIESGSGAPEELIARAAPLEGQAGIEGVVVRTADATRHLGAPLIDLGGGHHGSAEGFAQANDAQNDVLRGLVKSWATPSSEEPTRVLELYAGDGNFTRDLVRRARVVAVEGDRDAAARLVENLRTQIARGIGTLDRWSVRAESAATAVRRLADERFDVIVLDPPRSGAADAIDHLGALGAQRLVYVSCDPMTLARDLARLATQGYRAIKAQPLDMMPHPSHIEVVTLLEKS